MDSTPRDVKRNARRKVGIVHRLDVGLALREKAKNRQVELVRIVHGLRNMGVG